MSLEIIANVIDHHTRAGQEGFVHCYCGSAFTSFGEHAAHVAAAVLDALVANGYAVIQLPEPLRDRMWPVVIGGETEFVAVPAKGVDGDPIGISGIGGLSVAEANSLAAALLAAVSLPIETPTEEKQK